MQDRGYEGKNIINRWDSHIYNDENKLSIRNDDFLGGTKVDESL